MNHVQNLQKDILFWFVNMSQKCFNTLIIKEVKFLS